MMQTNIWVEKPKNRGFYPPKSSILIGFSIINHPFWGVFPPIFGNTHIPQISLQKFEDNMFFVLFLCEVLYYSYSPQQNVNRDI